MGNADYLCRDFEFCNIFGSFLFNVDVFIKVMSLAYSPSYEVVQEWR